MLFCCEVKQQFNPNNITMKNIIKSAAFLLVIIGVASQASANCYTEGGPNGCVKPKHCSNPNPKAGSCVK
jgi:hypothetical protein